MARYTPAQLVAARAIASYPNRKDSTPVIASVKHHEYSLRGKVMLGSCQPVEDRPSVQESPLWTACPERRRGKLASDWQRASERKGGRKDGWGDVVARHDSSDTRKRLVTKSSEIHPPIVRASDGAKNTSVANAQRGQAMRDGIADNWARSQAPYGLKPIKSTHKLGAGK